MNNRDETCLEINEIVYHLAGQFWRQTYNNLVMQLSVVEKDDEVTPQKVIPKLRKEIIQLAKNNQLTCKTSSMNGHYYFSLIPFPIYIGVDKSNGEISVATPHINTMHFQYNEYKSALVWIQNYINVDVHPLIVKKETVHEKYYLNTKTAEIVKTSISSLAAAILGKKGWRYEINQHRLRSEIYIETSESEAFKINVYHKAFSQDSSLLVKQLNTPHEEFIEDKIQCILQHEGIKLIDKENMCSITK